MEKRAPEEKRQSWKNEAGEDMREDIIWGVEDWKGERWEEVEGREDSADNELSIETKAELYNFIMRLILMKDKCNNDKDSLMRLRHQITHRM